MSDANSAISTIVRQSCVELFGWYGIELVPEASARPLSYCGVIGFSGCDLRGSLMLGCTDEVLRAEDVRDWLGELTNQFLGRVKARLLTFGVAIYGSLPTVLVGERIAPIDVQSAGHLFSAEGGIVSVWFDALTSPGLVLAPAAATLELDTQAYLF